MHGTGTNAKEAWGLYMHVSLKFSNVNHEIETLSSLYMET